MGRKLDPLTEQVLRLPESKRILLIERLLESLEPKTKKFMTNREKVEMKTCDADEKKFDDLQRQLLSRALLK